MDKSKELWNTFMQSGKISDYLSYRDAIRTEIAMEDKDASEHRGTGDPGEGIGRK